MNGMGAWPLTVSGTTLDPADDCVFHRFMMDLREQCLEMDGGGNNAFWKEVCTVGRSLSLISKTEAANAGGRSRISESVASEVGYKRTYVRLLLIRKLVTVRRNQVMYLKLKCIETCYRIASPPSRT